MPLEARAAVPAEPRGGAEATLRIGRMGAVLVRPDGHVAWPGPALPTDPEQAPTRALLRAAAANSPGLTDPAIVNGPAWHGAEVPAVNGHGIARAVAGLYAHLLGHRSGSGGLLAREIVAEALRSQGSGPDLVLGRDVTWGLGVAHPSCFRAFTLSGPSRLVVDVQA